MSRTIKTLSLNNSNDEFAKKIKLKYVYETSAGFTRKKISAKEFIYLDIDGKEIIDQKILERINKLAIPPAYKKVWICDDENGHIQATGVSNNGKKQYIYHPQWQETRNEAKFSHMIEFAETLPKLRRLIREDLKHEDLNFNKVMALIIMLLDKTHIRIGNESSAINNKSYGLTTLRKKHIDINDDIVEFHFNGKSNQEWIIKIEDPKLLKIIEECHSIPGYKLFKYFDENNVKHEVTSSEVNEYLQNKTKENITAKNFRTWAGTVKAVEALSKFPKPKNIIEAKKKMNIAIKTAAKVLGNTPTICRKNYIHPIIIQNYLSLNFPDKIKTENKAYFSSSEAKTLELLKNLK